MSKAAELASAAPLWRPLSLHDAALINAVGALITPPVPDPVEQQDALEMIGQALVLCSRDHVLMRDLAVAAEGLLSAWPGRKERPVDGGYNPWARARHDAAVALGAVMRVRAAQALGQAIKGVAR